MACRGALCPPSAILTHNLEGSFLGHCLSALQQCLQGSLVLVEHRQLVDVVVLGVPVLLGRTWS